VVFLDYVLRIKSIRDAHFNRNFPDQISPQETRRHDSGEHTQIWLARAFFSIATPLDRGTDHKSAVSAISTEDAPIEN
jgi:hypothetical protein